VIVLTENRIVLTIVELIYPGLVASSGRVQLLLIMLSSLLVEARFLKSRIDPCALGLTAASGSGYHAIRTRGLHNPLWTFSFSTGLWVRLPTGRNGTLGTLERDFGYGSLLISCSACMFKPVAARDVVENLFSELRHQRGNNFTTDRACEY
jgi:hypothetical protein